MSLLVPRDVEDSLRSMAGSLERLVTLYERDLESRNIRFNLPPEAEEGEILVTDTDDIAELIARIRANKPVGGADRGFYVESPDEATPRPAPEDEVQAGWDHPTLFGRGWGLNAGPEGAEEDWGGPPSQWRSGETAPGDVRGPGDRPKSEGEGGPDRRS